MPAEPVLPRFDPALAPSADYRVQVDGREAFVYPSHVASFCGFQMDRPVAVRITPAKAFEQVKVRPLSRGVVPDVRDGIVTLHLPKPMKLSVEFDDRFREPLFLFADAIPDRPLPAAGENVRVFAGGQIHEPGPLRLESGQSLVLEAGAVVRAPVYAENASDIRILGPGVFDGSHLKQHECRMMRMVNCRNIELSGFAIHNSPSWTVVPAGCEDVTIQGIKIVNGRNSDDGIDVNASRRVTIDDVFVRTKDDCIAIKAAGYDDPGVLTNVEDVTVTRGVFWNAEWGNALEIGFETRCDHMRRITFRDCDVIRCEREGYYSGGTFTIHNGDRASVEDVLYEDIRVEDSREKLFDFKVQHSHYSKDAGRGHVRRVIARNIAIVDGPFPPSILQSFDRDHRVEDVLFENLTVHGTRITNPLDARMIAERCVGVRFV